MLLAVILLGVVYCVRLLRALHQRLSKLSSQNIAAFKELKAQNWQSYCQAEALQQLIALLKFTAPIPPTRSWAASPDLLLTLVDLVRTHKPKLVVELGSGVSTLIVAKAGAKKVISIDNSEEFAGKTRAMLKAHGVRGVKVRIAALKPHVSGVDWYDTTKLSDLKKIDLLIIDGPPGSKNPDARKPARPEFINRLSPRAIILIDDVNRQGERELAEAFAKALPNHVLTIYPHEKGTAVISPK
ncbi:MAG: class I SAM-dependent methyltransferase [Candidatus Planktophila sp.]|nr:class I SAM-dependent methyltransferase [Candidatus Planktophila sp.]